jgi:hypothetical protein
MFILPNIFHSKCCDKMSMYYELGLMHLLFSNLCDSDYKWMFASAKGCEWVSVIRLVRIFINSLHMSTLSINYRHIIIKVIYVPVNIETIYTYNDRDFQNHKLCVVIFLLMLHGRGMVCMLIWFTNSVMKIVSPKWSTLKINMFIL